MKNFRVDYHIKLACGKPKHIAKFQTLNNKSVGSKYVGLN
jgi:hypothetical protein